MSGSDKAFRFIEIEDGVLALREDISLAQAEENLKQLTLIVKALWGSSRKAVQSLSLHPPPAFLQPQRALTNQPSLRCFNCRQLGHRSRDCPANVQSSQSPQRTNRYSNANETALANRERKSYNERATGKQPTYGSGGGAYGSGGGAYGSTGGYGGGYAGGYGGYGGGGYGSAASESRCDGEIASPAKSEKGSTIEEAAALEETDEWTPGDDPPEEGLEGEGEGELRVVPAEENENETETETRKRALETGTQESEPASKKANTASDSDDWCPQPIIAMDLIKEEAQHQLPTQPQTLNIEISDDDEDDD